MFSVEPPRMDAILVLGGGRFFVAKPVEKVVQNTTVESVKSLLTVVIEIIFCAVKFIVATVWYWYVKIPSIATAVFYRSANINRKMLAGPTQVAGERLSREKTDFCFRRTYICSNVESSPSRKP